MAAQKRRNADKQPPDLDLQTGVDDELYDELSELEGQRIVHVTLWEDSLLDALEGGEPDPDTQTLFDLDLYLEEGIYFELYGASAFESLDAAPVEGDERLAKTLLTLVDQHATLDEIAVDEDDNLVLILAQGGEPALYLAVGGWLLEEWDELPG